MSDALARVRAAAGRLKVFPLPAVVVLPGSALPLHIFEERYRQLVEHALAHDGVLALAQVQPGQESRLEGAPPLEEVLGVGVIGWHEQLPDGRYNLVLIGVARARLLRELPRTHLYREVEAEVLEDAPGSPGVEAELRDAVNELVVRLPREVGEQLAHVSGRVTGGALADVVAATVLPDATRRYEVLCTLDVDDRVAVVAQEVRLILRGLRPTKPSGLMN